MNKTVSFFLFIILIAATARADFTFIHVSDMHVGAGKNAETDAVMLREISALNPKPAFIAGTGDLCEIGTEQEYEDYRAILPNLTLPAHQAPGNHDVRWNPLGKEGFTKGSGEPMYQSWSYEGIHFVLLDSTTLLQHWGHFDSDMLAWLKKDLQSWGTEKPVVIGFHHPIGKDSIQCDNEQELMDLVAPFNVRLWLQGHGHSNVEWNINGTPAIMVQGLYQGAYNIIEVKGDELHISRRFLKQPKKDEELVGDKKEPEVMHKALFTVSLKKPIAPRWDAKFQGKNIVVTSDDLPADAQVSMRVDQEKYEPMPYVGREWVKAPAPPLAGEHRITVQATLSDGRAYQKPLKLTVMKTGTPKPAWEKNAGGAVMSRLVRDGDLLYVPSMGGDLVAMDAKSGTEKWRAKTKGGVFSTPQVDGETVYFGSADHSIYAVDAKTGHPRWSAQTGGAVFGGASVAKGVVCIASCDKNIYGLDAITGKPKWVVKTGGMTQSKVATDGNLFCAGTWDNTFRGIDAASGEVKWSHKFGKNKSGRIIFYSSPAIGSPTIGDGKVFISSNDGLLHAVDIASGEIAWETKESHQLGYCGPLFRDGKIYQASLGGNVYCFDAKTGDILWKCETGAAIYDSSCAFAGDKIFVGCVNGTFNAVNAADGKIAWQYLLGPGHVLASPAADEAKVYISSMSGRVTALPVK